MVSVAFAKVAVAALVVAQGVQVGDDTATAKCGSLMSSSQGCFPRRSTKGEAQCDGDCSVNFWGSCSCKGEGHCSSIKTKGGDLGLSEYSMPDGMGKMRMMFKVENGEWSMLNNSRWQKIDGFHGDDTALITPSDGGDVCDASIAAAYIRNLGAKKMAKPPLWLPEEVTPIEGSRCPIEDEAQNTKCGFQKGVGSGSKICFAKTFDPDDKNTKEFTCAGSCAKSTAMFTGPDCVCTTGKYRDQNCGSISDSRDAIGLTRVMVDMAGMTQSMEGPFKYDRQTGKFCVGRRGTVSHEWVYAGDSSVFGPENPAGWFVPNARGPGQAGCDLNELFAFADYR